MRSFLLLTLIACDSGRVAPRANEPTTLTPAMAMTAPTTDAAPLDSAIVVEVPAALAAAPAWVGRMWTLGAAMVSAPHTTYTLQRDGTQALLTIEVREPTAFTLGKGEESEPTTWHTTKRTQYLGTATSAAGVVSLDVAHASENVQWECKTRRVKAGPPRAVRGRTPGIEGCGGDQGRWVPGATKTVEILACEILPKDDFTTWDTSWNRIGLAPAPGVEWLFVNDHCVIQGGGWRQVAADGAIAGIREHRRVR